MDVREFDPEIDEFYSAEESILYSKLKGIRAAISHAGEKGRSIETAALRILRDFLPSEYGLSTGFIMYHDEDCIKEYEYNQAKDKIHLSKQLDIIIYDAVRCGPIVKLDACDVFPLESVYAYVEVKTSISRESHLVELFEQSERLRAMKVRLYWSPVRDDPTGAYLVYNPLQSAIPIRSYIFILEATNLGNAEDIRQTIERIAKTRKWKNATITGMYVNGKGFYYLQPVNNKNDPRSGDAILVETGGLLAFKNSLYNGLSRYPRIPENWTPAINLYSRSVGA